MENKKRFGVMVSELKECNSITDKISMFKSMFPEYEDVKVNFAVFNKDCLCIKIHKSATLMDLFRYVTWSGYRGSVDQILLKMKYTLESGKDLIHNIELARDFNLNILICAKKAEVLELAVVNQ